MAGLRLGRLPDRTPVKLGISVTPDLHHRLQEYAKAYALAYGTEEPLVELVPAMLSAFLDSDKAFSKVVRGDRS